MSAYRSLDRSRFAASFRGLSRPGAGWHSTTTLWHTGFLSHCVIEGAVLNVPLTAEHPVPPRPEPVDVRTRVARKGKGKNRN